MKGMEELQIEGLYVPVLAPSSALHTCMALDFDSTVPGLNSEQGRHCAERTSRALRKHPAPLSFSDLHSDRAAIKRETIDRLNFVASGCEGRDLTLVQKGRDKRLTAKKTCQPSHPSAAPRLSG